MAMTKQKTRFSLAQHGPWTKEHGSDFAVPVSILQQVADQDATDESWHNDTCPRFSRFACSDEDGPDDENRVDLWVEHPDPERRENPGARFVVTAVLDEDHGDPMCMTDDVNIALAVFLAFRFPARPIDSVRIAQAADRLELTASSDDDLEGLAAGDWTSHARWTVEQCLDHSPTKLERKAICGILWNKHTRAIGRA